MFYVLLGAPGSGKGTQKELFLATTNKKFNDFSAGDSLREARANNTPLGQKAAVYMDAGDLVPDDIIIGIVSEKIKNSEGDFISDGFPRTVGQAQAMLDAGLAVEIIYFEVDETLLVDRISNRRVCENPDCKKTYNATGPLRPIVEGICDKCGCRLARRKDDDPEVFKHRLEVYREQTFPVLDFLRQNGVTIHTIDSSDFETARQRFAEVVNR